MATVTELDLRPTRLDLDVYRGDDLVLPFAVTQGGTPVDISSWQLAAQVRRTPDATEDLAPFTIIVTNGPGGLGQMSISAVVLNDIEGDCVWDLQRTSYPLRTLLAGKFSVTPDVTR